MKREKEVILGAIVFVGIAVLVAGATWLSENYWGPAGGYKIYTTFESVMGLKEGNEVALRGVTVGKVLEIEIERGRPLVLIGFRTLRDIPRDSKIIQRSVGMLGERIIEVRMGDSEEAFRDGDLAIGTSELGMEDMTSDAADMTNSIKTVVDSMTSPENILRMTRSLRNVDTTTAALRKVLQENETTLVATIENLSSASADASGLMDDNRAKIERAISNLGEAAANFAQVSKNIKAATTSLEGTLANLETITTKINTGQGTLGKLVNDPSAYDGMSRSIANVDSLVEAIKRNPSRFLNFKFTIF